ncbi:MAG: hypothetical protein KUF74_17205 [Candidatus Thiodiazotropha sp. (ex Ctena orbiculata)]|nr:hypothetical protein [Candidatus Thiodiazotropha taylori]
MLIDVGTTTTDLIPFLEKQVLLEEGSDHRRLVDQTLVYTGIVRTPLMAIATKVPFAGEWVDLMAEHFATTAEFYCITGELPEDAEASSSAGWKQVAKYLAEQQLCQLQDACERLFSRPSLSSNAALVRAGSGHFLIQRICRRFILIYVGVDSFYSLMRVSLSKWLSLPLPQYWRALLWRDRNEH